jgi:ATP-dependent Lhr-like helicase
MEYFLGRETPAYKDFMEEREAIGLLKKRVKSSRVNLACINCGATAGPYTLSFLTLERLRCPTCKGRLLAPYFPSEENLRLIKKIKRRAELEGDEEQLMERLRTAAKLVSRFGVRALWCLQAYGVGVETAKRILSHSFMDEDDLFKRILDAQKIYFETRMYWKD